MVRKGLTKFIVDRIRAQTRHGITYNDLADSVEAYNKEIDVSFENRQESDRQVSLELKQLIQSGEIVCRFVLAPKAQLDIYYVLPDYVPSLPAENEIWGPPRMVDRVSGAVDWMATVMDVIQRATFGIATNQLTMMYPDHTHGDGRTFGPILRKLQGDGQIYQPRANFWIIGSAPATERDELVPIPIHTHLLRNVTEISFPVKGYRFNSRLENPATVEIGIGGQDGDFIVPPNTVLKLFCQTHQSSEADPSGGYWVTFEATLVQTAIAIVS